MIRGMLAAAAALALTLGLSSAEAQNLSLRGPAWAQPLLATDVIPTTGGRAALNAEGIDVAARVTIVPNHGGIARVIRYEARGNDGLIALRRFTGHTSTGFWLWGGDTPYRITPSAAVREEMARLVRAAMGVGGAVSGADTQQTCSGGEQAYVELALGGRSTSATRMCVTNNDPVGRLVTRLSELGGSRTEEELAEAAVREVLDADRAFAAMAQAEGVPAAFAHWAAQDTILMADDGPREGVDAVRAAFADWPDGARLEWTPVRGGIAARGDMGWTWGTSVYIAPDGTRQNGRYVTVWKRDYDGNWRFAFDGALRAQ